MKNLRVDILGLVGIELHAYDPGRYRAASCAAICLSPHLVQHAPQLIVADTMVDLKTTTLGPKKQVGGYWHFDVSGYNLSIQMEPPNGGGITLPQEEIDDPEFGGGRKLGALAKYVPDMATLTGFSTLKPVYRWSCDSRDVVSAFILETGSVRAKIGQPWFFWEGPLSAPTWSLKMKTAEIVCCHATCPDGVKIAAVERNVVGGAPLYLCFKDVPKLYVRYQHHCEGIDGCGKTHGAQLPVFYDMLEAAHRRPYGMEDPVSETGYCPPTLFW